MTGKSKTHKENRNGNKLYGWLRQKHAAATSLRCKGKSLPKRGPHTEEMKERFRKAMTGKVIGPCPQERRDKISKALTGRTSKQKGKPWSEKRRAAQLKRKLPNEVENIRAIL